ncbi:MAG: LysM peptidoglycan-binding domain-containing protein [bacterium]|nr:LysM peptidoglycan-binding domain-containing protein [bacterium]
MKLKKVLKKVKLSEENISMVLGALVVVVIGVLIFNYFRGVKPGTVTTSTTPSQTNEVKLVNEDGKMVPEGLPTTHKVEKGEDLWKIADKYFGSGYNWVDIARENKLKNANHLLVGQTLNIPKGEVKQVVSQANTSSIKQTANPVEIISGTNYTVERGDTLWKIAVRSYQDGYRWVDIAKANKLAIPNMIHPGNTLTLPR